MTKKSSVDLWKVIVLIISMVGAILTGLWSYSKTYASREQVAAIERNVNRNKEDIGEFKVFFNDFRKEQRLDFKEFRMEQKTELREIRRVIENR